MCIRGTESLAIVAVPFHPVPYRRRATKYNNGMDDSEVGAGGWGLTAFATTDHFSVAFSTKWRGDGVHLPLPPCLSLFAREHLSLSLFSGGASSTHKRWYQRSRGRGVPSAVHDKWKLRIEPINRDCELKN